MAINTKTELKALVTANKLTSDLLNNIIDSTSGFDSNGDYVVSVGGSEVLRINSDGNTSKNGGLIPATLSTDYSYVFDGLIVTHKTNTGAGDTDYISANNCYFDGTNFRSIANTGLKTSFYSLSPTSFIIRESTSIVTSENQIMIMTVVITPT